MLDPVALTQALIRCPSVTPADAGALDVVADAAEELGFTIHRLDFDGTPNLFARRGEAGPHFCFAGHTDVVPPGEAAWSADPFGAELRGGAVFGRGACDMKGAVAAFLAAVAADPPGGGSVSLLITGDEEGPATGGTVACSTGWRRTATSPISAWWASRPIPAAWARWSRSAAVVASTP